MRYLVTIFVLATALNQVQAQDVFQSEFFNVDMILKYRSEIDLSEEQAKTIKSLYNSSMSEFNSLKWDLDYAFKELKEAISPAKVDLELAESKMQTVLELEEKLKMQRLAMFVELKNELTSEQQAKLKELRTEEDMKGYDLITPLNQDPRVVLKVEGEKAKPLYIIIKGGKEKRVSAVTDLEPDDIESIEVLKGEAAVKSYGKEGKNGVVVIKMKDKK